MYCPQCSQQQISDEMRFCSRCGFPLTEVRRLMSPEMAKSEKSRTIKGVRQGAFIMLAGVALTFVFGLLTVAEEDFVPLLFLPALCYVVGFLRILYAVFIQERHAQRKKELLLSAPAPVSRQPTYNQLPPQRSVPVDAFVPPDRRTAEVIQPPSVTENTTKLLDDEEPQHQ